MNLSEESTWIGKEGPSGDVVMSCRVRLARNLAGFPFVNKANDSQRQELVNITRQVLLCNDLPREMIWIDLNAATAQDRRLLVERHLISRPHADAQITRGVAISDDESFSVMVNEEDHLRMQLLAPGLQLEQLYHQIDEIDDCIESRVDYAFSDRWGYLTACPTNVGTGIRFSVMMHLPALKLTDEIERLRQASKAMQLAVRGYYGEGTESAGDFYQISNQVTLGLTEQELLDKFINAIVPKIMEWEHTSRSILLQHKTALLDDRVHRAIGVLRSARLLGVEEAMKLLSRVRLGMYLERLNDVDATALNALFVQIQPGHLRLHLKGKPDADTIRQARATLVRRALS